MLPDKLLVNLRILGKIQKNGRITKSIDGIIFLESDTFYKNLKRFIYNDNRKQSVFEINSIIQDTSVTLNHLLNNKTMITKNGDSDYTHNLKVIQLLLKELVFAQSGIEKLKFTYKADENIISQIDIILMKIDSLLNNTNLKLKELGIELDTIQLDELS